MTIDLALKLITDHLIYQFLLHLAVIPATCHTQLIHTKVIEVILVPVY